MDRDAALSVGKLLLQTALAGADVSDNPLQLLGARRLSVEIRLSKKARNRHILAQIYLGYFCLRVRMKAVG